MKAVKQENTLSCNEYTMHIYLACSRDKTERVRHAAVRSEEAFNLLPLIFSIATSKLQSLSPHRSCCELQVIQIAKKQRIYRTQDSNRSHLLKRTQLFNTLPL